MDEDVLHLEQTDGGRFRLKLESGDSIVSWTIILAMGISRNRLNVPGEKELLGKGVSYCVDCDANFFRNQVVTVVGDGSAAASGALKLLLIAGETHLVCRQSRAYQTIFAIRSRAAEYKSIPGAQ